MAVALVGIFAVGAAVAVQGPIAAEDHGANGPNIPPGGTATFAPQLRTVADIQAADAALAAAGGSDDEVPPFMPTNPAEYAAAKAQGRRSAAVAEAPEAAAVGSLAPPTLKLMNWEGITGAAAGGLTPPDTHGAVGNTQYAQIVNAALRVFTKGTTTTQPTIVSTVTLKALFGLPSTGETIFDPRIIYDERWDRWVVVATRRSASSTDTLKRFYLAVSTGSLASGSWCRYNVNFAGSPIVNGDWWDYPQLGMDLDGLIVTGNVFSNAGAFRTAALMPIPKAQVYNCLGFSVPLFRGPSLFPTLAPPIVRDNNGSAFIISANGGIVRKYTLTNSSRSTASLAGPVNISGIAGFAAPADAPQPGTTTRLDTLEGRFVNASTQVGVNLWNTHAVASTAGGVPRVRWYRINTSLNNIVQQGTIPEASAGTYSYNASIAANDANTAVITYSSSSTTVRAQMRFTGKQTGDVSMPTGTVLATSTSPFTTPNPSRWGDYSAVSVDPVNQNHFWIINELTAGPSHFAWRSRMGRVGY